MLAKKAAGKRMADQEQLDILKQGVEVWNQWRNKHAYIRPDLSRANLHRASLADANLSGASLADADLSEAHLEKADLSEVQLQGAILRKAILRNVTLIGTDLKDADLSYADLSEANTFSSGLNPPSYGISTRRADLRGTNLSNANLSHADLSHADLRFANLSKANLYGVRLCNADLTLTNLSDVDLSDADLHSAILDHANLSNANLNNADLSRSSLIGANLTKAILTNCRIYGISAWNVQLEGATQLNLIITFPDEPTITVDNLEVAQFIYLLLNNPKIRDVIDTIAKKAVLILGRFTQERKAVLDALREALRTHGYVPILFDFDKPSSQDLTETVSTLAHLSRFIIVDLTDPSSAPYEVGTIASNHIRPIQALFQPSDRAKRVFAMFPDLIRRYHWVLPPYEYQDQEHLLASLQVKVIAPAEQKVQELENR
jgi:uncharacterized protein YjbI with pentapeptide repeats